MGIPLFGGDDNVKKKSLSQIVKFWMLHTHSDCVKLHYTCRLIVLHCATHAGWLCWTVLLKQGDCYTVLLTQGDC